MYLTAHGLSFNITPTGRFFGKLPSPEDIKRDIALVSYSGFVGYELWVEKLLAYMLVGSPDELAQLVCESGVRVPAFCFVGDFPDMGIHSAEPETARNIFAYLQAITCPVAVYVVDPHEGLDRPAAMKQAADQLREVADLAAEYRVGLAIEFIYTLNYMKTVADAIELMERVERDNVGISLDTFHFYMGGSRLEDVARIPPGRLYGIHVNSCPDIPKTQLTDKDRLPPGLGTLPFKEILDASRDQGYQEQLSVEILHDDYWQMDAETALRRIYRESASACQAWC